MQIDQITIEKYLKEALENLKKAIAFESYARDEQDNTVYGEATHRCLAFYLELANNMGFSIIEGPAQKYGFVEYGTGEKIFAITTHLDVVPSGDLTKWKTTPWDLNYEDGYYYGRGVLDDKGPAMVVLYALKCLKDHGYMPTEWKIRLVYGLTEETTWDSINAYLADYGQPDAGFVPDGEWPVIYAEQTIVDFDIVGPGVNEIEFTTKGAYNVVCDEAILTLRNEDDLKDILLITAKEEYEHQVREHTIHYKGVAAHGSTPENGTNAIWNCFDVLRQTKKFQNIAVVKFMHEVYDHRYDLGKIFPDWIDETGTVRANLGLASLSAVEQKLSFNLRVPVSYKKSEIYAAIKMYLNKYHPTLQIIEHSYEKPVYVPLQNPLVEKLMATYQDITGDYESKPKAIGGGTYARAFDNCLAFGAANSVDSMHGVNERVSHEDLKMMINVYIKSILALVA